MANLFCGIDLGSTNVKVVLADESGRAVYTHAVPTPRVSDGIGLATDATALVALLEAMIIAGWREVGWGTPLTAIASAGVGEDGIGVDAGLCPTGLSLPWFDMRAHAEAVELRRADFATPHAGIAVGPDRTAAKWLWLRRHRPEDLRSARQWIALTDYPAVWWSGSPFMSSTLAPRTACFDVYGRRWITGLLDAAGSPPLPALKRAGAPVGTMRPGPLVESGTAAASTLLVAGGHDHPIAAATIRGIAPTARVDSMGTANLIYGEANGPREPYLDPFMTFSVPPSGAFGVACLGVMELSAALDAVGNKVLLHDLLGSSRLPGTPMTEMDDNGDGLDGTIRRALEGATFHARRMLIAMDQAGAPPGPIYATGGWARSRAFLELRASIFGQPIHILDEPELTAIGAAFLAAEAANGERPSLTATRTAGVVEPVASWMPIYAGAAPLMAARLEDALGRHTDDLTSAASEPGRRTPRDRHQT